MSRISVIAFTSLCAALLGTACTIESKDDVANCPTTSSSSGGSGSGEPDVSSSSGGSSSGGSSSGGSSSGGSSSGGSSSGSVDENPDPANFLPIPEAEGTVRAVVEGEGWTGYDRSCTEVASADSYHSVGFGDTYIQMTDSCAEEHGANALFKVYRAAGLAAGVYDITPSGDVRSKVGLTPPDRPWRENDLTGKLWIRSVTVGADDTVLEASYYGTAEWPKSEEDSTLTEVTVQVALKVRLRNTDVP